MATYQVQVGDTVTSIANRFGVPTSAVKGFRSNDPNVILPGETLEVGAPAAPVAPVPGVSSPQALGMPQPAPIATPAPVPGTPAPNATLVTTGKPVYMPPPVQTAPASVQTPSATTPAPTSATPSAPVVTQPQNNQGTTLVQAPGTSATPPATTSADTSATDINALMQRLSESNPDLAKELLSAMGGDTSGDFLKNYGIDPEKVKVGFETAPTSTLPELINQVMQATGLSDVRTNINSISFEIETLANERDEKIRGLQDNPFNSAGTKEKQIQMVTDQYEQKIANRVNRLTLMQNAYTQARQEAQFAVSTAIGLYDKNRQFNQDQLDTYLDQVEKAREAEAKLVQSQQERADKLNEKDYQVITLKDEYGNDYTRIFDKKKGTFTDGGGGASIGPGVTVGNQNSSLSIGNNAGSVKDLVQVGQILSSSFTNKFQQTQFLKTMRQLEAQGNVQGLAEHIFARAIDNIPDSAERKNINGRYEMVKRLNRIQDLLTGYKQAGGETSFFKGNIQDIKQRFGQVGDKNLASIGVAIANAIDEITRFRTGAALSAEEEKFYQKILPGTWKSSELNTAIIGGLRDSLAYDVDNSLRRQLTSEGYALVSKALTDTKSPIDQNQAPAVTTGPKEGDTKVVNGYPYMRVKGGWQLQASVKK